MGILKDLLDNTFFSGVPSNAIWDLMKLGWNKVTEKSWEDLYLESFQQAVNDAKPLLSKYADSDGEIEISKDALEKALRRDLAVNPSTIAYDKINDEQFASQLATAMVKGSVLTIGGHNLSQDDYTQIIYNLVQRARANFKTAILANQEMFRCAMLDESQVVKAKLGDVQLVLQNIQEWLASQFDLTIPLLHEIHDSIEEIKSDVKDIKQSLNHNVKGTSPELAFVGQLFQLEPWLRPLNLQKVNEYSLITSLQRVSDIISENSKIILAGNSGSGKTIALKMACNELNQQFEHNCIWIPLKNYSKSLGRTIKENLAWPNIDDEQVIGTLEEQNITIFLDGLNEVTLKERDDCIREIQILLDNYKGIVCVSYPLCDLTYFGFDYPTYTIAPLEKDEIERTIKEFFSAKGVPNKSDWFLQTVRGWDTERQNDFDKLASLPINLQFLLELATGDTFSYNSLGDLYGQVIQRRLARAKLHNQRSQLSIDLKIDCLMGLAYQAILKDHQLQMQKEFVREIFTDRINSTKADADLALDEIVRAGLLVETNEFLLEWPHSSFRDYLAGRHLFNVVESEKPIGEFPIDKPTGVMAAAHATRLLTTQSRKLENRSVIFSSAISRMPSLEIIKSIAEEYYTALDYYRSGNQDFSCDTDMFKKIKWGERFLESFRKLKLAAEKNGLSGAKDISAPNGLRVFFDTKSDFCLVLFSGQNGIQFDDLEVFNRQIVQRQRHRKTRRGFCLFAPFLLLLDPEIVAYREFGMWLRLISHNDKEIVNNWHHGLAIDICPKNEWLYWCQDKDLPKAEFEISSNHQETMEFLHKNYGRNQVNQIIATTDVLTSSKKEFLSWEEIYMPITIQIDPIKTLEGPSLISSRAGQVMIRKLPGHNISLILLMPFMPALKMDFPSMFYVPFPVGLLSRYYFLYYTYEIYRDGQMSSFFHLRG